MADKNKSAKKTATVKKVAAKKVAVKKPAEGKAPAAVKKVAVKKASSAKKGGALTRILAKVDAGWGNQLFIRGCGGGLSWDKGVLMQCISDDEWLWEKKIDGEGVCFKILVNDDIWSVGEDCTVPMGETVILTPCFLL